MADTEMTAGGGTPGAGALGVWALGTALVAFATGRPGAAALLENLIPVDAHRQGLCAWALTALFWLLFIPALAPGRPVRALAPWLALAAAGAGLALAAAYGAEPFAAGRLLNWGVCLLALFFLMFFAWRLAASRPEAYFPVMGLLAGGGPLLGWLGAQFYAMLGGAAAPGWLDFLSAGSVFRLFARASGEAVPWLHFGVFAGLAAAGGLAARAPKLPVR